MALPRLPLCQPSASGRTSVNCYCGIRCLLILPVFAVGMAPIQDKLLMSRRSPGRRSAPGAGGRCLPRDTPGAPPPPTSWPVWCLLDAEALDSETPSCELAGGYGRAGFHLLVPSFDEAVAGLGQTSGNRCWWKTCQNCAEGKCVMHMLLDTGGLGKP